MRIYGLPTLNILDLIQLKAYFLPDCPFGKEVKKLLDKYHDLNLKPLYKHQSTEYSYQHYTKIVNKSCLVEDFVEAFVCRFKDDTKSENELIKDTN